TISAISRRYRVFPRRWANTKYCKKTLISTMEVMSPIEEIIATLFVVLLCPLQEALASFEQCKEATFSIPNRVLVGHALLTKPSPSIGDCMISCIERDPLCESINYYRKTKICELNDKNINSNSEDMVDFEWAIYMTNSERVPPCNLDDECGRQTDICRHLRTGGNNCKACNSALGLESEKIPDAAITASSYYDHRYTPSHVRLNSPTAWIIGRLPGPHWLQVDLGQTMAIKEVATQGRHDHQQWVISYSISSSVDGTDWVMYMEGNAENVFQGNTDMHTVVSHVFPQHIRARFIRIWPKTWKDRVSMRAELYGCSLE
ncbi:hypothetical protein ACROYT_G015872, partial [Oculina patagonica]